MTFKKANEIADLVDISSSDDEDIAGVRTKKCSLAEITSRSATKVLGRQASQSSQPQPQPQPQPLRSADITPSLADYTNLHSRSFWKAGSVDVLPTAKSQVAQGELEHARVHPKFLHSNATSHKWAFGAIAELLDNAIDEVQNGATYVKVDKIDIKKDNSPALLFQDDGGGMEPSGLRKCMSLGYSSKKSDKTIGQYGNGFKTSTMRLGADVIVFSRATRAGQATQSVGLLSYTFLRKTGQDDVIVPMIDFDVSGHWAEPIMYGSQDDWNSTLEIFLEWSPFTSKEDLMAQFEDIGPHGTKIIIYNLWLNDESIYELSFDDDDEDIRLRDEAHRGGLVKLSKKTVELQSHISYQIRYSLRAYASILYLRKFTNFHIILRGKAVQQFSIVDDLKYLKVVTYKPQLPLASKEVIVETTIGFIKEAPDLGVSGFNVYHKNRLIMPFWKVTRDGSCQGNGVVGVLEANFMEPAHDKQEFERSLVFIRLETRLKQMVAEYWKTHCECVGHRPPRSRANKTQRNHPPLPSVTNSVNFGKRVAEQINVSTSMGLDGLPENTRSQITLEKNLDFVQHTRGPGVEYEVVDVDNLEDQGALSTEEIREENIRLFMRCEEHLQNQIKFKQKIQDLEKELKEAKMKRDQLSSYVESRKRLNALKGETKRF